MFVFEDITNPDDRAVQMVLRSVDMTELAVALKGVDSRCARRSPATCRSAAARTSPKRSNSSAHEA